MPLLTLHTTGDGQVRSTSWASCGGGSTRGRHAAPARQRVFRRPGPLRLHVHRMGRGARGARALGRARRAPAGQRRAALTICARASSCPRGPGTPEADRVPGARAPRDGQRSLHARRRAVRRPLPRRGGRAWRAGHALPARRCRLIAAGAARSPSWPPRRRPAAAGPGARIALWTFADGRISSAARPGAGPAMAAARARRFASARPNGTVGPRADFYGSVYRPAAASCPAAPGRGVHRAHALRRGVRAPHRELLRLQPRASPAPTRRRLQARRDDHLPRQRPARARNRAQRARPRRPARPDGR